MAVSENKKNEVRQKLESKAYKKWFLKHFDEVDPDEYLETEVFKDDDLKADERINLLLNSLPEENKMSVALLSFLILESNSYSDLKAKLGTIFQK